MIRGVSNDVEMKRLHSKLMQAVRLCCFSLPHLSGLSQQVKWILDDRVRTAGVTASGRVLFNPIFLDQLELMELAFVVAHELYHLILQSHWRRGDCDPALINRAHDLIINDILGDSLGMQPPAGGLYCPGAKKHSLESLVCSMLREPWFAEGTEWKRQVPPHVPQKRTEAEEETGTLRKLLADAGVMENDGSKSTKRSSEISQPSREAKVPKSDKQLRLDVINKAQELALFPDESQDELICAAHRIRELVVDSIALQPIMQRWDGEPAAYRWERKDRATLQVDLLRRFYETPWERSIQVWLDSHIPSARTYTRASRRLGVRTDVALPGRASQSTIVNVLLDTSGSMWGYLPGLLGGLQSFCDAAGVQFLRVAQCDVELIHDEVISVDELSRYTVEGFCGWEGESIRPKSRPSEPTPVPATAPLDSSLKNVVHSKRVAWLPPKKTIGNGALKYRRAKPLRRFKRVQILEPRLVTFRPPDSDFRPNRSDWIRPDSDLSSTMRKLAEDPNLKFLLILTDGETETPSEEMPYDILWVIANRSTQGANHFSPAYGQVISFPIDEPMS
jgi:hypothetical protein